MSQKIGSPKNITEMIVNTKLTQAARDPENLS